MFQKLKQKTFKMSKIKIMQERHTCNKCFKTGSIVTKENKCLQIDKVEVSMNKIKNGHKFN